MTLSAAPEYPRAGGGDEDGQGEDEVEQPGTEHGHERQDDHEIGEGHPGVDHTLHGHVVDAADIGAGHSDGEGHEGGQRDGDEAHGDGDARAVDHAAPHVAREIVRAHPELGAGRLHAGPGNALVVGVVGDPRCPHRHQEHDEHEEASEGAERLATQKSESAWAARGRTHALRTGSTVATASR
jgi:hypothetical protein